MKSGSGSSNILTESQCKEPRSGSQLDSLGMSAFAAELGFCILLHFSSLVNVFVAKHYDQKQHWEEMVYSAFRLQSTITESQDWNWRQ